MRELLDRMLAEVFEVHQASPLRIASSRSMSLLWGTKPKPTSLSLVEVHVETVGVPPDRRVGCPIAFDHLPREERRRQVDMPYRHP